MQTSFKPLEEIGLTLPHNFLQFWRIL